MIVEVESANKKANVYRMNASSLDETDDVYGSGYSNR